MTFILSLCFKKGRVFNFLILISVIIIVTTLQITVVQLNQSTLTQNIRRNSKLQYNIRSGKRDAFDSFPFSSLFMDDAN